jgi:hypothetical protein
MAVCSILWTFGKIYDHLVHFVLIWNIFPVSVSPTKKNLATLIAGLAPERRIRSRPSVSNLLNLHTLNPCISKPTFCPPANSKNFIKHGFVHVDFSIMKYFLQKSLYARVNNSNTAENSLFEMSKKITIGGIKLAILVM